MTLGHLGLPLVVGAAETGAGEESPSWATDRTYIIIPTGRSVMASIAVEETRGTR